MLALLAPVSRHLNSAGPAASARVASERYIWSVTPCLMAWPAVTLQAGPGSLIVGTVLGVVYAIDR